MIHAAQVDEQDNARASMARFLGSPADASGEACVGKGRAARPDRRAASSAGAHARALPIIPRGVCGRCSPRLHHVGEDRYMTAGPSMLVMILNTPPQGSECSMRYGRPVSGAARHPDPGSSGGSGCDLVPSVTAARYRRPGERCSGIVLHPRRATQGHSRAAGERRKLNWWCMWLGECGRAHDTARLPSNRFDAGGDRTSGRNSGSTKV